MWPYRWDLHMFSRMERRTLWRVLPRESLFVLGVIISAIALCQFRGVKVSFNVARMAPMGWSVGSAVTVAMLTGATQQVVTAAAILAGQVSVTEKLKIFILDWNLHQKMRDFRFCENIITILQLYGLSLLFDSQSFSPLERPFFGYANRYSLLMLSQENRLSTGFFFILFCTTVPRGAP